MKPGNGKKVRKARLAEHVIGRIADIAPVPDEQGSCDSPRRVGHAGDNHIRPRLPKRGQAYGKRRRGRIRVLDAVNGCNIAAGDNTADAGLNPVVSGTMKNRRRRRIDPCRQHHPATDFRRKLLRLDRQPDKVVLKPVRSA